MQRWPLPCAGEAVTKTVQVEALSERRQQRLLALLGTEEERQRRMYELAASQWAMATGNAKPHRSASHRNSGRDPHPSPRPWPRPQPTLTKHFEKAHFP